MRNKDTMALKNGKVKEIWGRQFRIVKNGLDEAEVFSFISRLIEKNSELSRKLEHVDSLKRLAEKAVMQAAKQAQRIRQEAQESANEEAEAIVNQAKDQAQAEAGTIISEAETSAQERLSSSEELGQDIINTAGEKAKAQAEAIISEAEGKAKEKSETIIAEALQTAESTAQDKILSAEKRAEEIVREAQERADSVKSPATDEAINMLAEAKEKSESAETVAQEIIAKAEQEAASIKTLAEEESKRIISELNQQAEYSAELRVANAEEEGRRIIEEATRAAAIEAQRIKDEARQAVLKNRNVEDEQLKEKFDRLCDILLANSLEAREKIITPGSSGSIGSINGLDSLDVENEIAEVEEDTDLHKGTVQLDFPPPLDSGRVLKIHKYLSKIPQIKVLDIKGSARGGIRVTLFLNTRFPLLDALRELPEVERVSNGAKPSDQPSALQRRGEVSPSKIVVTVRR
jgi:vacuolar-type H+-ATPase subunit H